MATWFLAWTPRRWEWVNLDERVQEVEARGASHDRWSCGRTKKIQKGERIFLIKLAPEPRGLIGSGGTESDVRQERHWDPQSQRAGRSALYIDVCWDTLAVEPIISRARLNEPPCNGMHWDTQSSGSSLPPHIA
jgi:5-methylcytosine-specific restriction protein A